MRHTVVEFFYAERKTLLFQASAPLERVLFTKIAIVIMEKYCEEKAGQTAWTTGALSAEHTRREAKRIERAGHVDTEEK